MEKKPMPYLRRAEERKAALNRYGDAIRRLWPPVILLLSSLAALAILSLAGLLVKAVAIPICIFAGLCSVWFLALSFWCEGLLRKYETLLNSDDWIEP